MPGLNVRHVRELPPRTVRYGPWPSWLTVDSPVRMAIESACVKRLWAHQSIAADALAAGRHVVLTTGTASGKSLAYLLPLAAAALGTGPEQSDGVRWRRRPATSLYLAPTKALAHDQLRACTELAVPGWRVAAVDGDTSPADRRWARDHAHHPSPNGGWCESAWAGALGVTLGGRNLYYGDRVEDRPLMGNGPRPDAGKVGDAARMVQAVTWAATGIAVAALAGTGHLLFHGGLLPGRAPHQTTRKAST